MPPPANRPIVLVLTLQAQCHSATDVADLHRPSTWEKLHEYAGRVIVVVGQPLYHAIDEGAGVEGLPARIALAASLHARSVQLVGKAGEDPAGDAVVLALARGGVGHVALLRDAGMPTPRFVQVVEPGPSEMNEALVEDDPGADHGSVESAAVLEAADVDLALRYLTEFAVLVLADCADPEIVGVAAAAASWAEARLIVVVAAGEAEPAGLPPDAIVFEAPDADPDGVFAAMVGSFAAALDDGDDPAVAFRSSVAAAGWAPSSGDMMPEPEG